MIATAQTIVFSSLSFFFWSRKDAGSGKVGVIRTHVLDEKQMPIGLNSPESVGTWFYTKYWKYLIIILQVVLG